MSEIKTIGFITLLFSTLNIFYMYLMQNEFYSEVINSPSIMILFMAYIAWILMAILFKKYVKDNKDFSLRSVFTDGPLLGFVIYMCINVVLLSVTNWSMVNMLLDVLWGTNMFAIVTLITLMSKSFI